jgi:hypothetical protein
MYLNHLLCSKLPKKMDFANSLLPFKSQYINSDVQPFLRLYIFLFLMDTYTEDGSTDALPQILYGQYLIFGAFGSYMF